MASSTSSTGIGTATGLAFCFEGLSKWGTVGFSLSDTGFSKLYNKESHYKKDKDKYDLSTANFCTCTKHLIKQVKCIHTVSDWDSYML